MLIDSFEHAQADFDARLLIEMRNEAETVITATEKSLAGRTLPRSPAASSSQASRSHSTRRSPISSS
jgi:hypothetical protein